MASGISACGGGSGGSNNDNNNVGSPFDGKWQQSNDCTSFSNNSFYVKELDINNTTATSIIDVYNNEINCDGVVPIEVKVVSDFKYGKTDIPVAECEDGKATELDVTLQSLSAPFLSAPITGDANIRNALISQGVDTALPAFNLICNAASGNVLLTGDVSGANDGAAIDNRPDSMDLTNTLIPR